MEPERLAQGPTDAVAIHRLAHLAPRDEPEPRGPVVAPVVQEQDEVCGVHTPTLLLRGEELRSTEHAERFGKRVPHAGRWAPSGVRGFRGERQSSRRDARGAPYHFL